MTARRPVRLISVVMPVRNGEAHIGEQLSALVEQSYHGDWELIVVDNGCTDRTRAIVENFRERLPSLRVVREDRRGLGRARNAGALAARGSLLAYCDADDVVAPDWLAALAQAAPQADIVGGRVLYDALNDDLQRGWERPQPMTELRSLYGFLPYASGGNCAIWAEVARDILWDESFSFGASDIEFAWRLQLAGYTAAFAPDAVIQRRFRDRPATIARQHFRYGMAEPQLFRQFRDHGMPGSDAREALEVWRWLIERSGKMLRSREERGNWLRTAGARLGRVYGSLRWRTIYI